MAAFERVLSGIPEMDKALANIRLGDNVVFRVSDLSEFRMLRVRSSLFSTLLRFFR